MNLFKKIIVVAIFMFGSTVAMADHFKYRYGGGASEGCNILFLEKSDQNGVVDLYAFCLDPNNHNAVKESFSKKDGPIPFKATGFKVEERDGQYFLILDEHTEMRIY